jgi:type III restriction enzyme
MILKDYQEDKIKELLDKTKKLLGYSGSKKLIFKSPTGSGKTIMMAEFLKRLVEDREVRMSLSFIWTAPRPVLTNQSKDKLEVYFEDSRVLQCSFFEDLDDIKISENEILFFNWESVRREDLIYIRDNERDNNLSNVLKHTKEEGRQIILVIDESHYHAQSETSQSLITDIDPKLTIEVSATPVVANPDDSVTVQLEDVKLEGMIKKAVILNEDFENIFKKGKIESGLSTGSEELVIEAALKKREELVKVFAKENVNINPLALIQLPDRIGQLEDTMKDKVISILKDKYKISAANGKLAIWLSGEHVNKEEVEESDSEVEVLIFKQAIALGWDCPRAQILILFRQWHSQIFSIQTVGRIMRMPEPDKGHYDNEVLNYGYVYTNLSDIEIHEDMAKGYIVVFTSKRISSYHFLRLKSYYSERHREKTRLSPLFIKIFLEEAKKYDLKKKIRKEVSKVDIKLINDWKAEDIDSLIGAHIIGDKAIRIKGLELQKIFDFFVRYNLRPQFYPEDRSVGRIKDSIYRFFLEELDMDYSEKQDEILQIVLSEDNKCHFENIISKAKEEYLKEVLIRMPGIKEKENWEIPEILKFNSEATQEEQSKSVMQPFYRIGNWKTEAAFIELLEKSKKVEWWFKNGDRDATFFAVPYEENGEYNSFYVDFIVKLDGGRIGLFDTKSGITVRVAGSKIEGIYRYIQSENKKGRKLLGGIVTNADSRNYRGRWIYFDRPKEELKDNNFDNWTNLEL